MKRDRTARLFLEKFMLPPNDYEISKFGESSPKDKESGIKTILKYFPFCFTEEQLKENMTRYNLKTMFEIVKKAFAKGSGYTGAEIELSNPYQNTINSYIYNDRVNPAFVQMDGLFDSIVMGFLLAMFKWSKDFGNLETVNGDIQMLQLTEDCYWTIVAFNLAHEIAHAYLAFIGQKYTKSILKKKNKSRDHNSI